MAKELEHDVLRVIKDQNGNHVVQKMIELVPREHIDFIMDSMRGQVSQLASHLYGCRVIQRLLEHGSEQDKRDLLDELHAASQLLITDQYGNYVAQHIIQLGQPDDQARIIRLVTSQLLTLSKHKFASNVVEKCIMYGSEEERKTILDIITEKGSDPAGPLYAMMKDQYGNYVIREWHLLCASVPRRRLTLRRKNVRAAQGRAAGRLPRAPAAAHQPGKEGELDSSDNRSRATDLRPPRSGRGLLPTAIRGCRRVHQHWPGRGGAPGRRDIDSSDAVPVERLGQPSEHQSDERGCRRQCCL